MPTHSKSTKPRRAHPKATTLPSGGVLQVVPFGTGANAAVQIALRGPNWPPHQPPMLLQFPRSDLQQISDALVEGLMASGARAPRVPLEALADRFRSESIEGTSDDDITTAHLLHALSLMLENGDEPVIRGFERRAVEYLEQQEQGLWGSGVPRARVRGKRSLGAEALLKRNGALLWMHPNGLRELAERHNHRASEIAMCALGSSRATAR